MTKLVLPKHELPQWVHWLVYLLLGLAMTWPLARYLNTHFHSTDTDMFNVYWGNWWVPKALAAGQNPYVTKYLIYPEGFNLVAFAFSPFLALLSLPWNWIVPPVAAYNVLVWVTIVLNCVAMDQLVRYLTNNAKAALVAGITFGFAPAIVAERASHLNLSMVAWIPWAALFLTRLTREARVRDAILLATTIGLAFLTRPQVGALVLLFNGIYFVGLALSERKQWHKLAVRRLLLAGLLSLMLLTPLLIQMWQALQQGGGESLLRFGARNLQTDLLAYVLPPPQHPLLGSWTETIYQRFEVNSRYWAFAGYVPILLAIAAGILQRRKALPWLLTSLFFFVLALGPRLRFNGQVYPQVKLPYGLAIRLFAAIGLNEPNRFNLALMAALAVLVGLACAQLSLRFKRSWLLAVPALLVLAEYLVAPVPLTPAPPHSAFYDQMAADGEEYAIVDLPLTRVAGEVHRYYQTIHHKPIVGGWDHRVSPDAFAFISANPLLGTWIANAPPDIALDRALAMLSEANVRYIVLHKDQVDSVPEGGRIPERMRGLFFTLRPLYEDHDVVVLPVETGSRGEYNVVHEFGENVALTQPAISLLLPTDGRSPQLSVDICWLLEQEGDTADRYRLVLRGPEGSLAYEKMVSMPPPSQGLVCNPERLELAHPFRAGIYELAITPLWGEQALGTYTMTQPVHVLEDGAGAQVPAVGHAFPVASDAPIELLGYNLVGGTGFVWIDLYLRGVERHEGAYLVSLELLHPENGQVVVSRSIFVEKQEWATGDLWQERRILWLNDVPEGQYSLGFALSAMAEPDKRIPVFDPHTGEPWPRDVAILDVRLTIPPFALTDLPVSGEGRILVRPYPAENLSEPEQQIRASFEKVGELIGWTVEPKEIIAGEEFAAILYWTATNKQPLPVDYTVFVHLLDESGQIIAQHDGQPVDRRRPTHTWQAGDRIVDIHRLEWKTGAYTGRATLEVGLYDLQTLQRVPVYAEGQRLPQDRVILSEIEVK